MRRIFERYASRRSLSYLTNYATPPRHLIRRLTLGNATGIFKDNLVPFGANAEGLCPKRPSASRPPSPQGEGMCSRYFVAKSVSSRDGVTFIAKPRKSICGASTRGTKPPPGGINGFNRVKDSGIGSEVYKAYLKPPNAGRFCPITIVLRGCNKRL